MSIQSMGETINKLRKEKGITQEELGKAVGVSTQAVSKWECGGVPDIELLPLIADFFQISIDNLFGRNINDYSDIDTATNKYITSFNTDTRMLKAFEHCWALERSLGGKADLDERDSLKSIYSKGKYRVYSQMLFDSGITLMSLQESLPYFLIMPQPDCGWRKSLIDNTDYVSLLKFLSNENTFNSLILLFGRDNKAFTPKLLNKELNLCLEEAQRILESLKFYNLVTTSEVELDDEIQTIYYFNPNPAFIALLAFSKELISKPNSFYWNYSCRNLPYLK
jgi:transcriptional regulator with XRE-family HTH domain